MRQALDIIRKICFVLTIAGAAYVILNEGNVSAGYAAVPCVISLACGVLMRNIR